MRKNLKVINTVKNKDKKFYYRRIVFLTIIYLGLFLTLGREIVVKIQKLEEKQKIVNDLNNDLDKQLEIKDELKNQIAKYENDEEYLAKFARKKFNVSRENEIIFILPNDE